MKIQEYHPPTKFIGEKVELLNCQLSALPFVLRTEITVEVAYVGYLYIAAVNQFNYELQSTNYLYSITIYEFIIYNLVNLLFFANHQ